MKLNKLFIVGISSIMLAGVASAKKGKKSFEDLDTDKDGKLSETEYVAGKKDQDKAKEHFKKKDADGDGFLSKEEFDKKGKGKKKPKKKKDK